MKLIINRWLNQNKTNGWLNQKQTHALLGVPGTRRKHTWGKPIQLANKIYTQWPVILFTCMEISSCIVLKIILTIRTSIGRTTSAETKRLLLMLFLNISDEQNMSLFCFVGLSPAEI